MKFLRWLFGVVSGFYALLCGFIAVVALFGGTSWAGWAVTAAALGWFSYRSLTWPSSTAAPLFADPPPPARPSPRREPPPLPPLRPPSPPPKVPRTTEVFPAGEVDGVWRPPTHVPHTAHVARLHGLEVKDYGPDYHPTDGWTDRIDDPEHVALLIGTRSNHRREEEPAGVFFRRYEALCADPRLPELRGLLLGAWSWETCDEPPQGVWDDLAKRGPAMTGLTHLFLGEATQDEMEISWITLGDVGPVISAMPNLRAAWVRGGGIRLSKLRHPRLTHLTVQTGGLDQAPLDQLLAADLPALRSLVVWIGAEEYGGSVNAAWLPALLDRFPHLEHLGLQNAQHQDEVAEAVLNHPGVARLKSLDLSMGTLTDRGARAILACHHLTNLRHLNLRHHFIQDQALRLALEACPFTVDLSEQGHADDRYTEVAE
jgi:hypothetical protein